MTIPRYLYVPLGIQILMEVIARLTQWRAPVAVGSMAVTLLLCMYVGARSGSVPKSLASSALWTLPLTLAAFINGSLSFWFASPEAEVIAYTGFLIASAIFALAGIAAGLVGATGIRMARRIKARTAGS
jgi:hypothetical protein